MGEAKSENFFMNVTAVTHRKDPWFLNSYSGIIRNAIAVPREATLLAKYRAQIPGLLAIHVPQQAAGVHIVSIDKQGPGQGMTAGKIYADGEMLAKVIVVVDREISPYRLDDVWQVLGSRWQPYPAASIIREAPGIMLDPSLGEPPKAPAAMHSKQPVSIRATSTPRAEMVSSCIKRSTFSSGLMTWYSIFSPNTWLAVATNSACVTCSPIRL